MTVMKITNNKELAVTTMSIKVIERYVGDLLEISAVDREGAEQRAYEALHRLLTAVCLYEQMSGEEQLTVSQTMKKLQFFFCTKIVLKERKRKTEKKNFPPNPLLKENEEKEKVEKTPTPVVDSRVADTKKEIFRKECLAYVGTYDEQQVADFYHYWSEESTRTGKMRFEEEQYWSTANRLKRWVRNQVASEKAAATMRLERQKTRKSREQQREQAVEAARQQTASQLAQQARERERADAKREAEAEERRRTAVSPDVQIARNPTGFLAQISRERQAREARKEGRS